mgnify:CR=1 FL=1
MEHFDNSFNKLCFFRTLRDEWNFFPLKYSTFLQQIATASLYCTKHLQMPQVNKAFLALYAAGHWELSSSYLHNIHLGWKKYNQ